MALSACLPAVAALGAVAQSVSALPALDKRSLTGTWCEIAHLPNKRERHCAADAVELIALGDKTTQLQLVDACTDVKGYKDSWNFTAMNKTSSGAFKVRTIFPFTRKYWVIAVGPVVPVVALTPPKPETGVPAEANPASDNTTGSQPDASAAALSTSASGNVAPAPRMQPLAVPPHTGYAWTLIGMPNHKGLWIFARGATVSAQELDQIKLKASALGFDPARLVMLPQSTH